MPPHRPQRCKKFLISDKSRSYIGVVSEEVWGRLVAMVKIFYILHKKSGVLRKKSGVFVFFALNIFKLFCIYFIKYGGKMRAERACMRWHLWAHIGAFKRRIHAHKSHRIHRGGGQEDGVVGGGGTCDPPPPRPKTAEPKTATLLSARLNDRRRKGGVWGCVR